MFDIEKAKELYGCKNVYGPYAGSDGRQRVVLYYAKGNTPSKAYSRFLVEVILGRLLSEDEEVDHDDRNPSNDSLDNLVIRNKQEHADKTALEAKLRTSEKMLIICPQCDNPFLVSKWRLKITDTPCCSRSCSRRYNGANQYSKFGNKY